KALNFGRGGDSASAQLRARVPLADAVAGVARRPAGAGYWGAETGTGGISGESGHTGAASEGAAQSTRQRRRVGVRSPIALASPASAIYRFPRNLWLTRSDPIPAARRKSRPRFLLRQRRKRGKRRNLSSRLTARPSRPKQTYPRL